jgi:HSP90 family molecular chaperone
MLDTSIPQYESLEKLEMRFDPNTIEHLGIQLYSTLPPVIAELIANSYDADAKNVDIYLNDTDKKSIVIKDDGHGMTFSTINSKFLKIGRPKRQEEASQKSELDKRFVIGKKGIGKLSFFGVARTIEIETIRDGKKNVFRLDWEKIKTSDSLYRPDVIIRDQPTEEESGTKVILTNLKLKGDFDPNQIAYNLSKTFSIFDEEDFLVRITHNNNLADPLTVTNTLKYQNINIEFEWTFPL